MKKWIGVAAAAVLLTGCASTADQPAESAEPETQNVTVVLHDEAPFNAYFNLDDEQCHAGQLGDSEVIPPEVTISDGEGTILATEDGPDVGGTFSGTNGCEVEVEFTDLPVADIYVVNVNVSNGDEFDATEDGDVSSITVRM